MLSFIRIRKNTDTFFSDFLNLYVSAFPVSERRNREALEKVLLKDNFYVYATTSDEQFVGFVCLWTFDRFSFIEHFAVLPRFREQHLGSEIIHLLQLQIKQPIVLEVETPATKIAARRIHFWERLGFYVLSNYYMQPPYNDSDFLIPMLIMSNDYHFANRHFQMIKSTLYHEVYGYVPVK